MLYTCTLDTYILHMYSTEPGTCLLNLSRSRSHTRRHCQKTTMPISFSLRSENLRDEIGAVPPPLLPLPPLLRLRLHLKPSAEPLGLSRNGVQSAGGVALCVVAAVEQALRSTSRLLLAPKRSLQELRKCPRPRHSRRMGRQGAFYYVMTVFSHSFLHM